MIQSLLHYHLVHLCSTGINLQMFLNNCRYIISSYTLALLYQDLGHYLFPYRVFTNAFSKWRIIFKYYTLISFICSSCSSIISCSSTCYCSHKLDLSIVVLNLISLPVVYPPLYSSFIST